MIVAFIALFVILFLSRKNIGKFYRSEKIRLVVFAILFCFIALIPFLGLGNIAERYSSLGSIGFAIFGALVLGTLVNFIKNKKLASCLLILLTILLGAWYYQQINLESAVWHEAGRITNRTLSYLKLYYDGKHPNANFYFVNVPIR